MTPVHLRSKYSSRVVAEIIKSGKGFAIRYVYEGFNKIYELKNVSSVQIRNKSVPISVIHKLRRINSRNELTHGILKAGEEKPLKWFFQTQRDINKRLIKQLLDKENEDIQSGKLKKPYTDNELRAMLEALLRERHSERIADSVERIGVEKLSAKDLPAAIRSRI